MFSPTSIDNHALRGIRGGGSSGSRSASGKRDISSTEGHTVHGNNSAQEIPYSGNTTEVRKRNIVEQKLNSAFINRDFNGERTANHPNIHGGVNSTTNQSCEHTGNTENSRHDGRSATDADGIKKSQGQYTTANKIAAGMAGIAGSLAVNSDKIITSPTACFFTAAQHSAVLLSSIADNHPKLARGAKCTALGITGLSLSVPVCAALHAGQYAMAAAIGGKAILGLGSQLLTHQGVHWGSSWLPDTVREYVEPWLHAGTSVALSAVSSETTPEGNQRYSCPGISVTDGPDATVTNVMNQGLVTVHAPEITPDLAPAASAQIATATDYSQRQFGNGARIFSKDHQFCIDANNEVQCFDSMGVWAEEQPVSGAGNSGSTVLPDNSLASSLFTGPQASGSILPWSMAGEIAQFTPAQLQEKLEAARDFLTDETWQIGPGPGGLIEADDEVRSVNLYPQGETDGWVTTAGENVGEEGQCFRYQVLSAEPVNSQDPLFNKDADGRKMPANVFFSMAQAINRAIDNNVPVKQRLIEQAFTDGLEGNNPDYTFAAPVIRDNLDPAELASELDGSTVLVVNSARSSAGQPVASESVTLFSIDRKNGQISTVIGTKGFEGVYHDALEDVYHDALEEVELKASEQVKHRSVRSAGSGNSISFAELKPVYRLRSLPGNWVGGQCTLVTSDGQEGSFTVLLNKYDASEEELQRCQETFNSLDAMFQYVDWFFIVRMSGTDTKEYYIDSSYKKGHFSVDLLLISNEYHSATPEGSMGYLRRGIMINLGSGSRINNYVKLYIPDLPPPDILNCFPQIALAPFGDIPSMPGWFGGEVKLSIGGRASSFTVFMENDGSELAEQWQNSLCADNYRIHAAAQYLFAQLEGASEDIETIKKRRQLTSMPDWLPGFHSSDLEHIKIRDFNNDEYFDFNTPENSFNLKLTMVVVLNESSSFFGMSERVIDGDSLGYGKPAISLMIGNVDNDVISGMGAADYHLQYNSYKSIFINRGFYLDFNVEDNALPSGWFSSSLSIPFADDIGDIPFTGHLSSTSDLKKLRLTSRELIGAAGKNLAIFIIGVNDVSSINIPGLSADLSMSIQENEHSIDFNPGGETNQLILYPSDVPAFGNSMPAVVVNMGASVYENSVSFTFYRRLTINAPAGASEREYTRLSCPDNLLALQNGNCIGAVGLEHPGLGTVTTDVQLKSPDSIPWNQFYRPEVQYLISSLLRSNVVVEAQSTWVNTWMDPDHDAIVTDYNSKFGNSTHVSIEKRISTVSSQAFEYMTSGEAFEDLNGYVGLQPGEENMRLWLYRRDMPGNEQGVADQNNPRIALSIVHDPVQAQTKIKYCLFVPENRPEQELLVSHSVAATAQAITPALTTEAATIAVNATTTVDPIQKWPAFCQEDYVAAEHAQECGWSKGESLLFSHQSGTVTLASSLFLSEAKVKDTFCSHDLLGTAVKLLESCGDEKNEKCQSIKNRRFQSIQQNLGLAEGAVSLTVDDGSTTFPPGMLVRNNRLALSRKDSGQAGPNPVIVASIDNEISSVNFTIYKGGLVSLSSASRIPESLKSDSPVKKEITVFTGGSDKPEGYRQIRAPAILAKDNVVLICAEARLNTREDPGRHSGGIDIVCKRSVDSGLNFGPLKILATGAEAYKGNSVAKDAYQPTMVMDTQDCYQRMYLFYNRAQLRPFYRYSDDLGQTWSAESDFRAAIQNRPANLGKLAVNIASGTQMQDGKLVVPMTVRFKDDPMEFKKTSRPAVAYSDDHGKTWKYGGHMASGANEHQLVEVFNGRESRLLSSSRRDGNGARGITTRRLNYAKFDESTGQWGWGHASTPRYSRNEGLIVAYPISAATERYTRKGVNGETVNRLLFTLPHRMIKNRPTFHDLCVYISNDEGHTYPRSKLLHYGIRVGYSDIATLDGDVFLTVWEKGITEGGQFVKLTTANRAFLEDEAVPECNEN